MHLKTAKSAAGTGQLGDDIDDCCEGNGGYWPNGGVCSIYIALMCRVRKDISSEVAVEYPPNYGWLITYGMIVFLKKALKYDNDRSTCIVKIVTIQFDRKMKILIAYKRVNTYIKSDSLQRLLHHYPKLNKLQP